MHFFILVFIVLNVRYGSESKYPSIVFSEYMSSFQSVLIKLKSNL